MLSVALAKTVYLKRKGMGEQTTCLDIRLIDECRPSVFVGKMLKVLSPQTIKLKLCSIHKTFTNIGGYRLEWQLLNTRQVLPKIESGYTLSDTKPEEIGEEFFLSEGAMEDNVKRIKVVGDRGGGHEFNTEMMV